MVSDMLPVPVNLFWLGRTARQPNVNPKTAEKSPGLFRPGLMNASGSGAFA
jgi:hypothetical protein